MTAFTSQLDGKIQAPRVRSSEATENEFGHFDLPITRKRLSMQLPSTGLAGETLPVLVFPCLRSPALQFLACTLQAPLCCASEM